MKKSGLLAIVVLLSFWCMSSFLFITAACAEKIPALADIPTDVPPHAREQLLQRKQALEKDLAAFQAAAAVFNAKEAKDQSDSEYTELNVWRTRYINAAKAFNHDVAEAQKSLSQPNKVTSYTVQLGSARGEFSIENSDGSKFTNANIGGGRVARIDSGTRVTTGSSGRLQFVLPDDTTFTIGPSSDMFMDDFVYDTDNSPRKVTARLTIGFFRWVTGKVFHKDKEKMKVITQVVAIGIRGTDFETFVAPDESGYIKLFSGILEITPRKRGGVFIMKGKSMVKFTTDGVFSKPEPFK